MPNVRGEPREQMNGVVNWKEWLKPYEQECAFPMMARAIASLVENEKAVVVWISGSRATRQEDIFSDLDIRVYAPTWTPADIDHWLNKIDSKTRPFVRLSKLGPSSWNYECLFSTSVPIDLLVLSGEKPAISFDSVVFKLGEPLVRQTSLQVIKEGVINLDGVRNLMDGVLIDEQKFPKLLARNERLAALLLLDAERLALLRLAYVATRGVDCGSRAQHTLASLKLVRSIILEEANRTVTEAIQIIAIDGRIEENIIQIGEARSAIFTELRRRFPALPSF